MKRASITLNDLVYELGQQIADIRGFGTSFSAYIAWLIKRDAEGQVTHEDATLRVPSKTTLKTAKAAKRPKGRK